MVIAPLFGRGDDPVGGRCRRVDEIGKSDPVVGAARDEDAGRKAGFDFRDPVEVADVVLRAAGGPAVSAVEGGGRVDTEEVAELFADDLKQPIFVE